MLRRLYKHLLRLTLSALFLALAYVLPMLTGQIPEIGKMLSPMHIPVMLCGFICGPVWGVAVGFAAPLTRSLFFGMPVMYPTAVCMALELAVYGLMTGLMYRLFRGKKTDAEFSEKKNGVNPVFVFLSLIISMIAGRLVWGAARLICAGLDVSKFGLSAFWAGAVANAIPGIILQIILIPAVMIMLDKSGFMSKLDG